MCSTAKHFSTDEVLEARSLDGDLFQSYKGPSPRYILDWESTREVINAFEAPLEDHPRWRRLGTSRIPEGAHRFQVEASSFYVFFLQLSQQGMCNWYELSRFNQAFLRKAVNRKPLNIRSEASSHVETRRKRNSTNISLQMFWAAARTLHSRKDTVQLADNCWSKDSQKPPR